MKRIKASSLDPRREELLLPVLLVLLIPMLLIRTALWVLRKVTSPFLEWGS